MRVKALAVPEIPHDMEKHRRGEADGIHAVKHTAVPNPMINGHQEWLDGIVRSAKAQLAV